PWDLQIFGRSLYIAMAGPHQIWKLDLDKMEISTFAGSGREARHDGSLAESGFAQPSGLASDGQTLYVSDAEANIIRGINLGPNAQVKTLVGGDLFDFGDKDGSGDGVRLQHPLGLARWNDKLLIADTYNHRIKLLDPKARTVKAFAGLGKPGQADGAAPSFYEPGGLSIAKGKLYVADTNNHAIRVVDLNTKETKTLVIKGLQPPATNQTAAADVAPNAEEIKLPAQKIRPGDNSVLINLDLPAGYHLNLSLPLRVPIGFGADTGRGSYVVHASFTFVYCRDDNTGTCRIKTLQWQAPV